MTNQPSSDRGDIIGLGLALGVFLALTVLTIADGAPLGHDESVYALRAAWAAGDTSVNLSGYWVDYRAPGLPWVLSLIWSIRATEPYLRIVVALFGALGVVLTWWMARHLFGRRAAALAAVGLAASPLWIIPSARVWPDVPGATLGLATLAVLVWTTRKDKVSWWAVGAAPLAVATTVVRFGAPLSLLVGAVGICWLRWDAVRRSAPVVLVTGLLAGVGTALVLFTTSVTERGETPYQAVTRLRSGTARSILDGFRGYTDVADVELAGPMAVVLLAGIAASLLLGTREGGNRAVRAVGFIAAGTFVVLAASLQAELRYLAPVLPFAWMFAAFGLAELTSRWSQQVLLPLGLIMLIPLVFGASARTQQDTLILEDRFTVLKEAMQVTNWPDDCTIASSFNPQVGWYSGCRVIGLRDEGDPLPELDQVSHLIDVYGSSKEPAVLDDWLVANAIEVVEFGDIGDGPMRSVTILVPK